MTDISPSLIDAAPVLRTAAVRLITWAIARTTGGWQCRICGAVAEHWEEISHGIADDRLACPAGKAWEALKRIEE